MNNPCARFDPSFLLASSLTNNTTDTIIYAELEDLVLDQWIVVNGEPADSKCKAPGRVSARADPSGEGVRPQERLARRI